MANEKVKLRRGLKSTMPNDKVPGTILIATDTGEAYVDDTATSRFQIKDSTKLPLVGGILEGDIDLGLHHITNMNNPTDGQDAATKYYVDTNVEGYMYFVEAVSYDRSKNTMVISNPFQNSVKQSAPKQFKLFISGVIKNSQFAGNSFDITKIATQSGTFSCSTLTAITIYKASDIIVVEIYDCIDGSSGKISNISYQGPFPAVAPGASGVITSKDQMGGVIIDHKNMITSGTVDTSYGPAEDTYLSFGDEYVVPVIKLGHAGHISEIGQHKFILPSKPNIPKLQYTNIDIVECESSSEDTHKIVTVDEDIIPGMCFIVRLTYGINIDNASTNDVQITLQNRSGITLRTGYVSFSEPLKCGDHSLWILTMTYNGTNNHFDHVALIPNNCMKYEKGNPVTINTITNTVLHSITGQAWAGPTQDIVLNYGDSFIVPYVESDQYGHLSNKTKNVTITLPSSASPYVHPSYTPHTSGLYKVTVDNLGHVSAATAVVKKDITDLGIPGSMPASPVDMTGATTTTDGASGLAPKPLKGPATRYLRSDGTWQVPPDTDTVYTPPDYAATSAGQMSDLTLNYGGSFSSVEVHTDAHGAVSQVTGHTVKLPEAKIAGTVADNLVQFRNTVVVPKGTDPNTVDCPIGTIILVEE